MPPLGITSPPPPIEALCVLASSHHIDLLSARFEMTEARKAAKFLKKIATRLPHTNVGEKTAINLFKNVVVQLDEESGIRKEIEVDLEKYLNLFQKYLEQKQELPTKSPESLDPVLSSPRLDLHRIKMLLSSEYDQLKGPQSCDLLSYYLQTFTDGTNDEFCCIFFKVAFDCSINQYDFLLIRCLLTRIFESRHSNTVRVSSSCIWAFCAVQVIASLKSSDPSTMDMLGGSLELMCHDNPDSVHATVAYFGFWLRKLQQDVSNVEWNIRELRFVSEMLTESLVAAAWSTKRALTSTVWARQEQKLDTPIAVLFLLSCLSSVRGLLPQVRVVEGKGSVTQVNAKQKLPQPSSSAMASSSLARLYDELLAAAFGLTVGLARPLWQSLLLPLLDATSASSDFDLSEGLATCRQVSEPFVAWFSSNEVAISATMRVLESFVVGSSDDEEGGDEGGGDDEDGEGSRNGPDGGDGGDGGVGARLRDRRKGAMRVGGARDNQTEDGQDGDEEEEDHAMLEFVLDTRGEESVLASLNRQESEGIVDVEAHAQADTDGDDAEEQTESITRLEQSNGDSGIVDEGEVEATEEKGEVEEQEVVVKGKKGGPQSARKSKRRTAPEVERGGAEEAEDAGASRVDDVANSGRRTRRRK